MSCDPHHYPRPPASKKVPHQPRHSAIPAPHTVPLPFPSTHPTPSLPTPNTVTSTQSGTHPRTIPRKPDPADRPKRSSAAGTPPDSNQSAHGREADYRSETKRAAGRRAGGRCLSAAGQNTTHGGGRQCGRRCGPGLVIDKSDFCSEETSFKRECDAATGVRGKNVGRERHCLAGHGSSIFDCLTSRTG